jgi:transcriptional regulator with XRE-family HTH domain
MDIQLNQRLVQVRKHLRLSQKEFAKTIGFTQTYISDIENGRRPFTLKIAYKIEKQLKINKEWLLTGNGDMLIAKPLTSILKKGELECIMGVGNGGGNLFIKGSYEAVKIVQGWLTENEAYRKRSAIAPGCPMNAFNCPHHLDHPNNQQ